MVIFLIVALVFALALLSWDARMTGKGVAAGIAVEGSWLVRKVTKTDKPTAWQVFSAEAGVTRLPIFFAGMLLSLNGLNPLAFIAGIALVIYGIKNIQGAREWKWMFAHPGQKLPVMNTVWEKFIGFWG